jgi:hypothetical protein
MTLYGGGYMDKSGFKSLYERNKQMTEYEEAVNFLLDLEVKFTDIDNIDTNKLDEIISYFVYKDLSSVKNFVILMRYYKLIKRNDLFVHLTRYTGMLDVVGNILIRLKRLVSEDLYKEILDNYEMPYLGLSPKKLPFYIEDLMNRLNDNLSEDLVKKVLTGNNHGLSENSQIAEKIAYENALSLKDYLKDRHARKVQELETCFRENKVWFEQVITEDVIEYVKGNQEILSAVLKDDTLLITKIPYDTSNYLNAENDTLKKYYGCHCPFAREAIIDKSSDIDEKFCYCSAGFAKFPFEVILGQKLPIKVIESILGGSDICRFEIDLKDVKYKK